MFLVELAVQLSVGLATDSVPETTEVAWTTDLSKVSKEESNMRVSMHASILKPTSLTKCSSFKIRPYICEC